MAALTIGGRDCISFKPEITVICGDLIGGEKKSVVVLTLSDIA